MVHAGSSKKHASVTKDEAVGRLRAAGHKSAADRLNEWRDKNGKNYGWDGYIRRAEPTLVRIVWP